MIDFTTGDTIYYKGKKYFVLAVSPEGNTAYVMDPGGKKMDVVYTECEAVL